MIRSKYWMLPQTLLLLCILFSPFKSALDFSLAVKYFGLSCLIAGGLLVTCAIWSLKNNLKSSPEPKPGGYLITTGLYCLVRHPAYSGIVIAALGFSLWMDDLIRIFLTLMLFIFFDVKSRVEEIWLEKVYPEYASYKRQATKRFIPGVY